MKMYRVYRASSKPFLLVRIVAPDKETAMIIWNRYIKGIFREAMPINITRNESAVFKTGTVPGYYDPFGGFDFVSVARRMKIDHIFS